MFCTIYCFANCSKKRNCSESFLEKCQLQCMAADVDCLHRPNHGIQTMYEFAEDAGDMERSKYFGFSKDLYHFDHFLGMY